MSEALKSQVRLSQKLSFLFKHVVWCSFFSLNECAHFTRFHWINKSLVNLTMCFKDGFQKHIQVTQNLYFVSQELKAHSGSECTLIYSEHFVRISLSYWSFVPGKPQAWVCVILLTKAYSAILSHQVSLSMAFLNWSIFIWECKRTLNSFLWTESRARKDYSKSHRWHC